MIARILTEAVVPKKNDFTLRKYIEDWGIPDSSHEKYNLSDGKPGTWFVKEIEMGSRDIIVFSISRKLESGIADYILAYYKEKDEKTASIIHYAHFGDFCDPNDKEQAKINSACVRKFIQDLTRVSTVSELSRKMKEVYHISQNKKVWR